MNSDPGGALRRRTEILRLVRGRPVRSQEELQALLRRRGFSVNHKRVYRLYKLDGLHIRTRRRRRYAASPREQLVQGLLDRLSHLVGEVEDDHRIVGRIHQMFGLDRGADRPAG